MVRRKTTAICLLPLLLGLVLVAQSAWAAFAVEDANWEGTSELLSIARTKLGAERVVARGSLDWSELKPADGVLVVRPDVALDYDSASEFLRAGGRIAVLDDFGKGAGFLEHFQIHRIPAPKSPTEPLRGNPNLAVAEPAEQDVAGIKQGRHPIVQRVDKLVTNYPTALTHPNLTPVLTIRARGEPDATLAVTGIIVSRGRLFAMGDPSAVINLMMRYPGNRAFAEGLVDYLVEDDSWGARGGKLYLVSGDFKQRGHFGERAGLLSELREYLEGFLEIVADMHDGGMPGLVAILLAGFVALAGVIWIGRVSTRTYRRTTPRYAAAAPLPAQGGVAGRAAVLAAPTTPRALVLLEIQRALYEGLAERLGLEPKVAYGTLLAEIERRGALSGGELKELKLMMSELAKAEEAVGASRPLRVSSARIQHLTQRTRLLLAAVDQRLGESS